MQVESEQARLTRLARVERDAAAAEQPVEVADAWDDSGDDEGGSGSADEAVELDGKCACGHRDMYFALRLWHRLLSHAKCAVKE